MKKPNVARFQEAAKEVGLEHFQLQQSEYSSLKIATFAGEVEKYTASHSGKFVGLGIYEGKLGCFSTEKYAPSNFLEIANAIKEDAIYKTEPCEQGLYEGAPKYKKKKLPLSHLTEIAPQEKIDLLKDITKRIMASDPRISPTVSVNYSETAMEAITVNDRGMKLPEKDAFAFVYFEISAQDGNYTKSAFAFRLFRNLEELNIDEFVKEGVDNLLSQFGGKSIPSGSYPTVLKNTVFADLVDYFVDASSAEEVEKKTTYLLDCLGKKVASSKVTISEKPLEPTSSYYYFDSEGVPATTKDIVKKGVLCTYLHNRETAARAGVASTGNAVYRGGKFRVGARNIFVKPSKHSFEELIAPISEGVYITDIQGLGTGMNSTTGDFSCQASGYLIKDGKIDRAVTLITVGGNLVKMLQDVKELSSRLSLDGSSAIVPDAYIKKMQIGGE